MLDQIVMNLAVNARDAMPEGGRLVIETSAVEFNEATAALAAPARPGPFVCLSFSDSGCGIPPEILPRIFDPVFTTKEVGKGTGLGLTTVFNLVQQHAGWIAATSEIGRGATFKIYLPKVPGQVKTIPVPPVRPPLATGTETILLVEDDAALRATLQSSLEQLGYHVLEADDGTRALAVWREHHARIHLLLTDILMPRGMTGTVLARRLLKDQPELKVLYLSGYSPQRVDEDLSLVEGVNFLTKPVPMQKLARTLRTVLDSPANMPPTLSDSPKPA